MSCLVLLRQQRHLVLQDDKMETMQIQPHVGSPGAQQTCFSYFHRKAAQGLISWSHCVIASTFSSRIMLCNPSEWEKNGTRKTLRPVFLLHAPALIHNVWVTAQHSQTLFPTHFCCIPLSLLLILFHLHTDTSVDFLPHSFISPRDLNPGVVRRNAQMNEMETFSVWDRAGTGDVEKHVKMREVGKCADCQRRRSE